MLQFCTLNAFNSMMQSGTISRTIFASSACQKQRITICAGEPLSASGCCLICCSTVIAINAPANAMPSASTAQNSKASRLKSGTFARISASTLKPSSHSQ